MSYITQTQLESRFGAGDLKAWTDDDASGSIDATVVAQAIADTDGMIDAACAQHYNTPLTLSDAGTAAVVRLHAGSIAGYLLASRHPENLPDNVRAMYDDALKWLDAIKGGAALKGETVIAVAKPTGGTIIAGDSAVITRTTMDGF